MIKPVSIPPPPEAPPTRHMINGAETKESKAATEAWRAAHNRTESAPPRNYGEMMQARIAERDAKLRAIRNLAHTLIAKNGIDPMACREREIGLDLVIIIAGDD